MQEMGLSLPSTMHTWSPVLPCMLLMLLLLIELVVPLPYLGLVPINTLTVLLLLFFNVKDTLEETGGALEVEEGAGLGGLLL